MIVRAETREDHESIAAVTEAAFGKRREVRMVAAIRASGGYVPGLSLVGIEDGQVVGHVLLSYVELEGTGTRLLELGPLSVVPDRQRKGIGSRLVREALGRADARAEPLVLVLGHPDYYPRFGFGRASEIGIRPPDRGIPDAAFMAARLRSYDPAIRGRVVFPPAYSVE